MTGKTEKLVRMANQTAEFYAITRENETMVNAGEKPEALVDPEVDPRDRRPRRDRERRSQPDRARLMPPFYAALATA